MALQAGSLLKAAGTGRLSGNQEQSGAEKPQDLSAGEVSFFDRENGICKKASGFGELFAVRG